MSNTYKKINGSWGAWIDTGYGSTAIDKPQVGDTIEITTKAGEIHIRIVKKIIDDYKSGCTVTLEPNEEIAKKAEEHYQAASTTPTTHGDPGTKHNQPCPLCHGYCYGDCTASQE